MMPVIGPLISPGTRTPALIVVPMIRGTTEAELAARTLDVDPLRHARGRSPRRHHAHEANRCNGSCQHSHAASFRFRSCSAQPAYNNAYGNMPFRTEHGVFRR